MATVRFIIQADERKVSEGRYPVYLRVSDHGKREYFSTGFYANQEEFDDSKESKGRYRQGKGVKKFDVPRKEVGGLKRYSNQEANNILAAMESKVSGIIKQLEDERKDWTLKDIRERYILKRSATSLYSFANAVVIDARKKAGKFRSAWITEGALRSFKAFDQKFEDKSFSEVDADYLARYKDYCKDKGNKENTISIHLREIRRIFNIAIKKGVCTSETYPFGKAGVEIPSNSTLKRFLPQDAVHKIYETEFEDPKIEEAKHLFLFQYLTRGMNWKDCANLRRDSIIEVTQSNGNTVKILTYKRSKTGKPFKIQITPKIQEQLDWFKQHTELFSNYLLPIFKSEPSASNRDEYLDKKRKMFNRRMKAIAKELEFPESQKKISAYWARHTFAMAMFNLGRSTEAISQALGHADTRTTEIYLEGFDTAKMAELTDVGL
ncbi:MAG: site-specific integrase [Bacteroidales bacterium]|nr:site-specific integrase [Bacteroidales bacterium]